jgi:hypothetical protein
MAFNQDLARKKWLINRIEYMIQSYHEELKLNKQRFDNFSQRYLSTLQGWTNSTLAGIGVIIALATLIAALGQMNFIKPDLFQQLIVSVASGAVTIAVTLLIIVVLKHGTSVSLKKIDDAYLITINRISYVKGFFAATSFDIGSVTIRQFYAIALFLTWMVW